MAARQNPITIHRLLDPMRHRSLSLVILLVSSIVHAMASDGDSSPFTFLPGRSIFPLLPANHEEPRLGIVKDINTSHMRLDIGGSLDILNIRVAGDSNTSLRVGADFFAYALSTSHRGLRLQIDALDGYFGGHIVYREQKARSAILLRLRILHLSSHLLDGHFDLDKNIWIDGRLPNPFSRDYGELTAGHLWQWNGSELYVYGGFSYATLVRPSEQKRLNTLYGMTAHTSNWAGLCFSKPVHFYFSDHFLLWGLGALSGTNMIEAGVKVGEWDGTGIRLFVGHHAGLEVYHQYSDVKSSGWGLGFALEP
jgi:hypothetical protein